MTSPLPLIDAVEGAFDRIDAAFAAADLVRIGTEAPLALGAVEALVDAAPETPMDPSRLRPLCARAERLSHRLAAAAQGVAEAIRQLSAPDASATIYDAQGAALTLAPATPHMRRRL
jgi:hypothetical protein